MKGQRIAPLAADGASPNIRNFAAVVSKGGVENTIEAITPNVQIRKEFPETWIHFSSDDIGLVENARVSLFLHLFLFYLHTQICVNHLQYFH